MIVDGEMAGGLVLRLDGEVGAEGAAIEEGYGHTHGQSPNRQTDAQSLGHVFPQPNHDWMLEETGGAVNGRRYCLGNSVSP